MRGGGGGEAINQKITKLNVLLQDKLGDVKMILYVAAGTCSIRGNKQDEFCPKMENISHDCEQRNWVRI